MAFYKRDLNVGHIRNRAKRKTPHRKADPPYHTVGGAGRHHQLEPSAASRSRNRQRTQTIIIGLLSADHFCGFGTPTILRMAFSSRLIEQTAPLPSGLQKTITAGLP